MLYVLIFFILVGVFMFIHKLIMKRRMEQHLGRKVQDRELTSISAWMGPQRQPDTKQSPVSTKEEPNAGSSSVPG